MQFNELVVERRSVRKYKNKPVEKEKLELCLEAARMAPSASNSQPWTYIVVDEPELKEKVAEATYDKLVKFNKFTHSAPVIVVIVLESAKKLTQVASRLKKKDWPLMDIGISAENFCLQASDLGLGTCMLGWFREKRLKELLNIPPKKYVALAITLGYPDDAPKQKIRKPFNEAVKYNSY